MNQKEFIEKGKSKLPATILKWIWKNLDKIDDVIEFLMTVKGLLSKRGETDPCTEPKPSGPPVGSGPNGYWSCIGREWVWIEDLG